MAKEVLNKIYAKSPDPDLEKIARKQEYGQAQIARLAHVNALGSDVNAKLATDLTIGAPLLDTGRFYQLKKSGTKLTYTDGVFDGWVFISREFYPNLDLSGADQTITMGDISHIGTDDLRIWKISGAISCLNDVTMQTIIHSAPFGTGAQLDDVISGNISLPLTVCRIDMPPGAIAETHKINIVVSLSGTGSTNNEGWFDTEVEFLLPAGITPTYT